MKTPAAILVAIFALFSITLGRGNTLYVDLNSANPTPPYSDWTSAATNIQDAIDASADGDQIWVTNGVYQTGGKVMAGNLTNRVALDKAVTVQSVNGPFVTTIAGIGATNSTNAVRCAWLTNNASLIGFTLTKGATRNSGDQATLESGGAAWCASSNALLSACIIVSNTAFFRAGGAYQGTLNSCFVSSNSVPVNLPGAAVYSAILNNCTVVSNNCAGLVSCRATNSIIYYNNGNSSGIFLYCCIIPNLGGIGNFTAAPKFFPDHIHLGPDSPGIGAGTTPTASSDIFGKPWASPPTVGCAESAGAPFAAAPIVQLSGSPVGFTIKSSALGAQPLSYSWLKNGSPLQDDTRVSGTQSSNVFVAGVSFGDAANYQFILSNSLGSVTSDIVPVVIHCVDAAGSNPIAPYTNWDAAATTIQDAIDAALPGEIVLVTNGIYAAGGKAEGNDLTNRVALDKAILTTSVNGYTSTVIEGQWDPATNGPTAIRCAWLADGATLNGFTLRNGATRGGLANNDPYRGGGAWLSGNALISNCALTNNSAGYGGGGVAFGTANNCFLGHNFANHGGGAYSCRLNNCTVRGNFLFSVPSSSGAGVEACVSRNSIIAENYDSPYQITLMNYLTSSTDKFTNCCTAPLPHFGTNNINVSPLFLDYGPSFALAPTSPCRGAGDPLFATVLDLDGEPYLNPPSIGCDEIISTNLTGPLSFTFLYFSTNAVVNHRISFATLFEGRASELDWSFGDGTVITNIGGYASYAWTNTGTYTMSLTAYNADHPEGVSSNLIVTIDPFLTPTLQADGIVSSAFQLKFFAQEYIFYQLQYTTNLTAPASWITLPQIYFFSGTPTNAIMRDPAITNGTRFYRVLGQ